MRLLYSLAVYLLLPWAFCHLLWRARRQPEYLRHWGERLGYFQPLPTKPPLIWLHAVSVGETRAAQPLIAALRLRYPRYQILITHMTPTGRATSHALFGDSVLHCYLPYDTQSAVQRFLDCFQPQFGLILETELWPNLITTCHRRNIPLLLVNARLSERSAQHYARLPSLTRQALHGLTAIAAISTADCKRLCAVGRLSENAVEVTGNVKFDIVAPQAQIDLAATMRANIAERSIFLAASTRDGEEALILDAWVAAGLSILSVGAGTTASPSPLLIIVPRHPQRFDAVAGLIRDRGLRMKRRSDNDPIDFNTDVLLGDSMGEMFAWYALGDVAFIGGSLLDYGSQNLIEACAVGTPVLLGPSTHNFAEAASEALACGAAHRIVDANDLISQGLALLDNPAKCASMSEAGLAFALRHRGATSRTMALIARVLGDRPELLQQRVD